MASCLWKYIISPYSYRVVIYSYIACSITTIATTRFLQQINNHYSRTNIVHDFLINLFFATYLPQNMTLEK